MLQLRYNTYDLVHTLQITKAEQEQWIDELNAIEIPLCQKCEKGKIAKQELNDFTLVCDSCYEVYS